VNAVAINGSQRKGGNTQILIAWLGQTIHEHAARRPIAAV